MTLHLSLQCFAREMLLKLVAIQLGLCLKSRHLTLLSCQNLKLLAKNQGLVGDLSSRIREIPREMQYSTESPVRYHSSSPSHTIAAWL